MNINIFNRILRLLKFDSKNRNVDITESLQNIEEQEKKLTSSLTNLIFQGSKLKAKRKDLIFELEDIAIELDNAVSEDDEEISLYLLEKTDQLKSDIEFIDRELQSLESDITEIQKTKKDLSFNKEKYKNLLISHSYKLESLKAKRLIQSQIDTTNLASNKIQDPLSQLKDEILKSEAELKVLTNDINPIEVRLRNNKLNRTKLQYKRQFEKLKKSKMTNEVIA